MDQRRTQLRAIERACILGPTTAMLVWPFYILCAVSVCGGFTMHATSLIAGVLHLLLFLALIFATCPAIAAMGKAFERRRRPGCYVERLIAVVQAYGYGSAHRHQAVMQRLNRLLSLQRGSGSSMATRLWADAQAQCAVEQWLELELDDALGPCEALQLPRITGHGQGLLT